MSITYFAILALVAGISAILFEGGVHINYAQSTTYPDGYTPGYPLGPPQGYPDGYPLELPQTQVPPQTPVPTP